MRIHENFDHFKSKPIKFGHNQSTTLHTGNTHKCGSAANERITKSNRQPTLEQYYSAIIESPYRYNEVLAVPGSGKTWTLANTVRHLIDTGVRADRILVLSFSNSAANIIRRRICTSDISMGANKSLSPDDREVNRQLSLVKIMTSHSFANQLIDKRVVQGPKASCTRMEKAIQAALRSCQKATLWPKLSDERRVKRVALLNGLKAQAKDVLRLFEIAHASRKHISIVATEGRQQAQFGRYAKVLGAVNDYYEDLKNKDKVIDYSDMLADAIKVIEAGVPLPYTHVLVDEYQDCSAAQVHLIAALVKQDQRRLFVFGDPYQSIYGFSGAGYTPLSSVLSKVKQYNLPFSWRLTAKTAALATAVASVPKEHRIQTLCTGIKPMLCSSHSQAEQTMRVLGDIQRLIKAGTPPNQIIVLGRIKSLLHPIEQALLAQGRQTRRLGLRRNRRHAIQVLKLVWLTARCNRNNIEITPAVLKATLSYAADASDRDLANTCKKLKMVSRIASLEGRYRVCGRAYICLQQRHIDDAREIQWDVNRWEPLCRKFSSAIQMRNEIRQLARGQVLTSTIHMAKGGEWQHVFIVGVTDGLLPLFNSQDNNDALNDERNLLFVGITRAKQQVHLHHAPSNHARSRQRFELPSRFLATRAVAATLNVVQSGS